MSVVVGMMLSVSSVVFFVVVEKVSIDPEKVLIGRVEITIGLVGIRIGLGEIRIGPGEIRIGLVGIRIGLGEITIVRQVKIVVVGKMCWVEENEVLEYNSKS